MYSKAEKIKEGLSKVPDLKWPHLKVNSIAELDF